MVSAAVKAQKLKRTNERRERSVCIKLHKKVKKGILSQLLPTIHSAIDRVHFPRQDPPKFAFLVCNNAEDVSDVVEAITKFKNETVGLIKPKLGARPEKVKARPLLRPQTVLDPLKLVVTAPSDITKGMLEKLVPDQSIKISAFRTGQSTTFLLQFDSPERAFDAFEAITTSPAQGVKVKYFKKKVERQRKSKSSSPVLLSSSSSSDEVSESDSESVVASE